MLANTRQMYDTFKMHADRFCTIRQAPYLKDIEGGELSLSMSISRSGPYENLAKLVLKL